jgi:hypothetical protein
VAESQEAALAVANIPRNIPGLARTPSGRSHDAQDMCNMGDEAEGELPSDLNNLTNFTPLQEEDSQPPLPPNPTPWVTGDGEVYARPGMTKAQMEEAITMYIRVSKVKIFSTFIMMLANISIC